MPAKYSILSTLASPILLTSKKTGGYRFCVNFKILNALTIADTFPIPVIENILDALAGKAYYQLTRFEKWLLAGAVAAEDRPKTAFSLQGFGRGFRGRLSFL